MVCFRRLPVLLLALCLTVAATLGNLVYLVTTYGSYGLALMSALAVLFGGYMAISQGSVISDMLRQRQRPKAELFSRQWRRRRMRKWSFIAQSPRDIRQNPAVRDRHDVRRTDGQGIGQPIGILPRSSGVLVSYDQVVEQNIGPQLVACLGIVGAR